MKKMLITFAAVLLALNARAADLNAPMSKEVTVRSEIQRGLAAVAALPEPEHPLLYHRAVTAIVYENEQRNEDTKGFVFGVNYAAWHTLWNALSTEDFSDPFEAEIAAAHASICYTIAMGMQKELKLSDEDVRNVVGNYYSANEAAKFQSLLKSKQFKHSYPLISSNGASSSSH